MTTLENGGFYFFLRMPGPEIFGVSAHRPWRGGLGRAAR